MAETPLPHAQAWPEIAVREQHRMGLWRSLALCSKGVGHRLWRSAMTLAVIVLAVAFFMTLLGDDAYTHAVGRRLAAQQYARGAAARRLATWFADPDDALIRARLLAARDHQDDMNELASLTGRSREATRNLAERVHDEAVLTSYFQDLDPGTRARIVGKFAPRALIDELQDEARLHAVQRQLAETPSPRLPALHGDWVTVVHDHAALRRELEQARAHWAQHARTLAEALRDRLRIGDRVDAERALGAMDAASSLVWLDALNQSGFADDTSSLAAVQAQAHTAALVRAIRDDLATDEAQRGWRYAYGDDPPVDEKMLRLGEPRASALLASKYARAQLATLSRELVTQGRLETLSRVLRERTGSPAASEDDSTGLSARRRLLLVVSFVVCLVGIANAMFMAITERFREIATLKCLGATDGFILQQFLLEAALLGSAGGLLGAAIGTLLATLECAFLYGRELYADVPVASLAAGFAWASATGLLLAMLAAIAPAWSASRMAPMEAMRVE